MPVLSNIFSDPQGADGDGTGTAGRGEPTSVNLVEGTDNGDESEPVSFDNNIGDGGGANGASGGPDFAVESPQSGSDTFQIADA